MNKNFNSTGNTECLALLLKKLESKVYGCSPNPERGVFNVFDVDILTRMMRQNGEVLFSAKTLQTIHRLQLVLKKLLQNVQGRCVWYDVLCEFKVLINLGFGEL